MLKIIKFLLSLGRQRPQQGSSVTAMLAVIVDLFGLRLTAWLQEPVDRQTGYSLPASVALRARFASLAPISQLERLPV